MKRVKSQRSPAMGTHTDEESGGSDDLGSDTESTIYAMDPPGVVINDAVHGTILLPSVCMAVIDTKEFQRLRAVKQCGVCHLVYPSATHSRFEHSIGVCHWAREFLKHCGASVSDDKKLCVLLAGLCHDLGHGPFSHLWERFLDKCGVKWKHEPNSVMIFKTLVENNGLRSVFKKHGLETEHEEMICRLIKGKPDEDEEDHFLYEIIANDKNGLDVDKFEYIMRDAKQFGMQFNLDIDRIINNIGIVEQEGRKFIGFRDKISETLLDVFQYRAKLHRTCYQHSGCKAVELMLIDALVAANEHYRISWTETSVGEDGNEVSELKSCKLSECHENPNAFIKATDCLFHELLNSTSPELKESRSLLEAMLKRDLYTPVFTKKALKMDSEDLKRLETEMVERLNDAFGKEYSCEFRSCQKKYGIGESWSEVLFFDKRKPSVPFKMSPEDIKQSLFIGDSYNCSDLLIFCTKGKKSMTDEILKTLENCATDIYKTLAPDVVFQEVSSP